MNLLGPVWCREIICGGSAHTSYTTFLLMLRCNLIFLLSRTQGGRSLRDAGKWRMWKSCVENLDESFWQVDSNCVVKHYLTFFLCNWTATMLSLWLSCKFGIFQLIHQSIYHSIFFGVMNAFNRGWWFDLKNTYMTWSSIVTLNLVVDLMGSSSDRFEWQCAALTWETALCPCSEGKGSVKFLFLKLILDLVVGIPHRY